MLIYPEYAHRFLRECPVPETESGRELLIVASRLLDELLNKNEALRAVAKAAADWQSEANIRGELLYQEGALRQGMALALIEAQGAAEEYHEAWQDSNASCQACRDEAAARIEALLEKLERCREWLRQEHQRPRGS